MGEWEEGKEGGGQEVGRVRREGERYFQLSPPLPHSPPRCLSWITVTVTCSTSSRTPCASRTHGSWAWSSPPPDRPPPGPPQPQAARKTRAVPAMQEEEAGEEAELQAEAERGPSSLGCIPPRAASAMPVRPLWTATSTQVQLHPLPPVATGITTAASPAAALLFALCARSSTL